MIEKCFQLFIEDICHLQYGLDTEFCTNKLIYNILINVCQDIPIYQYKCFKLADILTNFINNLCFSIIIF